MALWCRDTEHEGNPGAGDRAGIRGKGRDVNQVIGALETIGGIIVAAMAAWSLTIMAAREPAGEPATGDQDLAGPP